MPFTIGGKGVIVLGDSTTHGGKVITASDFFTYTGIPVACVGDMVECPQCKGTYPIVEGAATVFCRGKQIARHGDKTACGATLISRGYTGPGGSFPSSDAAAIAAIDYSRMQSIGSEAQREYGGYVYQMPNGNYSYAPPVQGESPVLGKPPEMDITKFNAIPEGCKRVAIYHTHPGSGYNAGFFSIGDYLTSDSHYLPIYLGTEKGLVKRYTPEGEEEILRFGY